MDRAVNLEISSLNFLVVFPGVPIGLVNTYTKVFPYKIGEK